MIWFITNVDTEVLALRAAIEGAARRLRSGAGRASPGPSTAACPRRDAAALSSGCSGAGRPGPKGSTRCGPSASARGIPLLAFGGEAEPDAEMTRLSTVPSGTVTEALALSRQRRARELRPPAALRRRHRPVRGLRVRPALGDPEPRRLAGARAPRADRPAGRRGLLPGPPRGREHPLRRRPVRRHRGGGRRRSLAVWCYSLRGRSGDAGARPAGREAVSRRWSRPSWRRRGGGGGRGRRRRRRARRRGVGRQRPGRGSTCRSCRARRPGGPEPTGRRPTPGSGPYDAAAGIAVPEFDGRIIAPRSPSTRWSTTATSWAWRCGPTGPCPTGWPGWPAWPCATPGCAARRPAERRVAVVLSRLPDQAQPARQRRRPRHARLGHRLLRRAGRRRLPPSATSRPTATTLMAALADGLTYEPSHLTPRQLDARGRRARRRRYERLVRRAAGGRPGGGRPGSGARPRASQRVHDGALLFSGLDLGNVLVAIQPPRGYGDDPVAVYHSPNLAPAHHYLAFYRWLDEVWGADAIVHLGKHGTLEWLPGQGAGAVGGVLARRRARRHAVLLPLRGQRPRRGHPGQAPGPRGDHRPPAAADDPGRHLRRAGPARAAVRRVRPAPVARPRKAPGAARADLGGSSPRRRSTPTSASPTPSRRADEFDDVIVQVDGYLCELKDAQIRGGLHTLGRVPDGEALIDLVLAITRLAHGRVPSLRPAVAATLGLDLEDPPLARRRRGAVPGAGRRPPPARGWTAAAGDPPTVAVGLRVARAQAAPQSTEEIDQPPRRARRPLRARPGRAARSTRGRRPRAADGPQLLLPRPQGAADRAQLAGGPARWPTACSSATSPRRAATRRPSASCSGAPPRCAPRATTSPRPSRCSASARCGSRSPAGWSGSRPSRSRSWAGPAST